MTENRNTADWRPINTCPRDEEVILFFPDKPSGRNSKLYKMTVIGYLANYPYREPTHWMPLPKDPI